MKEKKIRQTTMVAEIILRNQKKIIDLSLGIKTFLVKNFTHLFIEQ